MLNNKFITVPKNEDAMSKLDLDMAMPDDLIELAISNQELEYLETIYFIDTINLHCHTLIDNYEEEVIIDITLLKSLIEILEEKYYRKCYNTNLLSSIINLFKEAVLRKTGVYFFF
jgi:hypothetical protein